MVDVTAEMEGQVLLVEEDRGMVVVGARLLELGDGVVDALDVGGVMLAVVNLVDLTGDVGGFQCPRSRSRGLARCSRP